MYSYLSFSLPNQLFTSSAISRKTHRSSKYNFGSPALQLGHSTVQSVLVINYISHYYQCQHLLYPILIHHIESLLVLSVYILIMSYQVMTEIGIIMYILQFLPRLLCCGPCPLHFNLHGLVFYLCQSVQYIGMIVYECINFISISIHRNLILCKFI